MIIMYRFSRCNFVMRSTYSLGIHNRFGVGTLGRLKTFKDEIINLPKGGHLHHRRPPPPA